MLEFLEKTQYVSEGTPGLSYVCVFFIAHIMYSMIYYLFWIIAKS